VQRLDAGFIVAALACVFPADKSWAIDFAPKTDNRIVCLDLRTGRLVWEHVPKGLSDAHFEVRERGLVVFPHYDASDRTGPYCLNKMSGTLAAAALKDAGKLLARSATFATPDIVLDNGWKLSDFSPGNSKTLDFQADSGEQMWRISTAGYPHKVRAWKNLVFYAYSYLSKEGVLYAYEAGAAKPLWTVDLNKIVVGRREPLTRMIFQVIDDVLYLEANEHVFALKPASGKLLWHRDLATDLGLKFEPDFFGGALNLAVFAKSKDVLVVSFERRVVALDLAAGAYLWHLEPDTFPHCPFPVAYGEHVFLTAGAKRKLHEVASPK
jgi:outer membrane protein assembly factor BamB